MRRGESATRPDFSEAFDYWTALLASRGLPRPVTWVFRENLCLAGIEGLEFVIAYETTIHPVHRDDARAVYDRAVREASPIVFLALAVVEGATLSTLQGDPFGSDDDVYVPEWDVYFCADSLFSRMKAVTEPDDWARHQRAELSALSALDFVYLRQAGG